MENTRFNITILDHYYNILVQENNMDGFTSIEYNALHNEYNYVIIEAEDCDALAAKWKAHPWYRAEIKGQACPSCWTGEPDNAA